ncbi:N-terminal phage integrase SAM-like domain-containing protein [Nonomuraea rubra]|uniref:Core-binding (CB) domain-containing protein n=1 Tax=Nonomuraea rubra TaxID=46180 RepID=A0A7X0NL63_9ACTN|nr:N-terminal phage integrase SAM-like domain-containing protein [Nonomuraea rubra]MBB6545465.1 hypothetical protein [Nonomuraea rubra]
MVYRRCGCADAVTGKRLGNRCARLANPVHGSGDFAVQVADVSGRRQRLRYWLSVVEQRIRPTTYKAYRDHVRLFLIPYLGLIPLRSLSRRHVMRMFSAVARRRTRYGKPISAATLERIRATLRAALNRSRPEDVIRDNPARGLRLPSPRHVHPMVWTPRRVAA